MATSSDKEDTEEVQFLMEKEVEREDDIIHGPGEGHQKQVYKIGDFVYVDCKKAGQVQPFLIRRIEEIIRIGTKDEAPDIRCAVIYRRRDISTSMLKVADTAERNWPDYLLHNENDEEYEPQRIPPLCLEEKLAKQAVMQNGYKISSIVNGKENGITIKEEEIDDDDDTDLFPFDWGLAGLPYDSYLLDEKTRYDLRQRELFLSRREDRHNSQALRGKCSVNLLCDIEGAADYLEKPNNYFYSLVYDNEKLSLLADKGAIRVGHKYQVPIPDCSGDMFAEDYDETKEEIMEVDENKENGDLMIDDGNDEMEVDDEEIHREIIIPRRVSKAVAFPNVMELDVWNPDHGISDKDLDRYLIHVRAIGVFARVIDPNSGTKYQTSQMIAAVASKDATMFYAFGLLHRAKYDIAKAQDSLIPACNLKELSSEVDTRMGYNTLTFGGPLLVRDQLEEFSIPEAILFEEGLDSCGKDFADIKSKLLPWKSMINLIEYYYLYKTTNRYIDGRKKNQVKPLTKVESSVGLNFNSTESLIRKDRGCRACRTNFSSNWYRWGARGSEIMLCHDCWTHWRKYGANKTRTRFDYYDTEIAADPEVDKRLLSNLSYATPSFSKTSRETKRFGANAYSQYIVVSAADMFKNELNDNSKNTKNITLKTNLFTKMVRRALPRSILSVKKLGRTPFMNIDSNLVSTMVCQMDQARLCEVMKQIVAPNLHITPSTFQTLVAGLVCDLEKELTLNNLKMSQFSLNNKRPASENLDGQPSAKRPPQTPAD